MTPNHYKELSNCVKGIRIIKGEILTTRDATGFVQITSNDFYKYPN